MRGEVETKQKNIYIFGGFKISSRSPTVAEARLRLPQIVRFCILGEEEAETGKERRGKEEGRGPKRGALHSCVLPSVPDCCT